MGNISCQQPDENLLANNSSIHSRLVKKVTDRVNKDPKFEPRNKYAGRLEA